MFMSLSEYKQYKQCKWMVNELYLYTLEWPHNHPYNVNKEDVLQVVSSQLSALLDEFTNGQEGLLQAESSQCAARLNLPQTVTVTVEVQECGNLQENRGLTYVLYKLHSASVLTLWMLLTPCFLWNQALTSSAIHYHLLSMTLSFLCSLKFYKCEQWSLNSHRRSA